MLITKSKFTLIAIALTIYTLVSACSNDGKQESVAQSSARNSGEPEPMHQDTKDSVNSLEADRTQHNSIDAEQRIYLMEDQIGGPYLDSWDAMKVNEKSSGSVTYITVFRDGKSGDLQVDMVINCKDGKYTFSNGIEFGNAVMSNDSINESIPTELPGMAINHFCNRK